MALLGRYLLLQLPGWGLAGLVLYGLHRWAELPGWIAGGVFALVVVKDAVLYPLVRQALAAPPRSGASSLVGARAVVVSRLAPEGRVQMGPELWFAETRAGRGPIEAGDPVTIREVRGLTLVVEPAGGEAKS